jgi:hypothetical protein
MADSPKLGENGVSFTTIGQILVRVGNWGPDMRTFFVALGAAMTLPLLILNWTAVIIGGIWLGLKGEWLLLICGIGIIFCGNFLITLLLGIPLAIGVLGAKSSSAIVRYPLVAIASVFNFVAITAWTVFIFSAFRSHTHDNIWPYLLWSYAIVTIPWVRMGSDEIDQQGTIMWISGVQFGAIAVMGSVLVGQGSQTPFGMIIFFVPIALFAMGMAVFMHRERHRLT